MARATAGECGATFLSVDGAFRRPGRFGRVLFVPPPDRPGAFAAWAVRPIWPLFAVMFGGAWFSWPWFLWNSFAVGSPSRGKEIAWVVAGVVGSLGMVFALDWAYRSGVISGTALPYAFLALVVWRLAVSYRLFQLQERTIELFEYYGGAVKNGVFVLLAGSFFLGPRLARALEGHLVRLAFW